jgi:histidyl-tRNA synthetase
MQVREGIRNSQRDATSVKIDNSPARGTRDLLPANVAVRDHVLESITAVYRRFGYQRIETPALEDIARLQGGQGGENEKLIFQVLRRGLPDEVTAGTPVRDLVDLGLRYDLTVPLTRFYGNNHAQLPSPFRSLQVGPVWRAERPQKGRYRQFYQCDIDLIGEPTVLAEAELIEATSQALAAVGLEGTTVRLSDRRFLGALAEAAGLPEGSRDGFFIILDKLDKIGWNGVRAELEGLGLPPGTITAAHDKIAALQDLAPAKIGDALADAVPNMGDDAIEDLATTTACLDRLAADQPLSWQFDPTLVRGMGYYTGQIFEMSHPQMRSSVAGGGRYDKLIGRSLDRDVPACGFSIGFERIVDLIERSARRDTIALLAEADVPAIEVLATARALRQQGQAIEIVRRSGKFGAQLTRLEASGLTGFVHLRNDNGTIARGEIRALGATDSTSA